MKELEFPFDSEYILKKKKSIKRRLLEGSDDYLQIRIAILSGSTVGELQNMIEIFLLQHGIRPVFHQGVYDRYYEEAVYGYEKLVAFAPDIVYIHTSTKNITHYPAPSDSDEVVETMIDESIGRLEAVWQSISEHIGCPIVQNNYEQLQYRIMGNADVYTTTGRQRYVAQLNERMYKYANENSALLVNDINYQSAYIGLDRWYDSSAWYLYKYPFAMVAMPYVGHNIANIIKSVFGKNKKALVLDLDDTLWGGLVGEEGVENISLGMETPQGMAYSQMQEYVKEVSQLGVTLSVCSKNNDATARTGFDHPSSVLSVEDFVAFRANWHNKDQNIEDIAREINIGMDSMVFVDDNPAERMRVSTALPMVAVPEMTAPEHYIDILDKSGYFEVTTLSADDTKRNQYYKDNKKRQQDLASYGDYDQYLVSMQMRASIGAFESVSLERIVQLINKTNQFNLTTKRMTSDEVAGCMGDGYVTLYASLGDKFGDNGIVSTLIGQIDGQSLDISLWVMSCRVFKRNLEYAMFDTLVGLCQNMNITKIKGYYSRTNKNDYVSCLYETLGFAPIDVQREYGVWEYSIGDTYEKMNNVIEVNNR